ncbi:MAG: LysE/ArgO family amino acid transporter [Paracoccaceae bacterium]
MLRAGLRGEHLLPIVIFCIASDAVLTGLGVGGFGIATEALPWLSPALRWAGVAFLIGYGALSFRSAYLGGQGVVAEGGAARPLGAALAACAAITWLNPHVYVDTLLLMGAVAQSYDGVRLAFWAGATAASCVFFPAVGYGAQLLRPLFAREAAWRVLDASVGVLMWTVALKLMRT